MSTYPNTGPEPDETVIWHADGIDLIYDQSQSWPYVLTVFDEKEIHCTLDKEEIVALRDALERHLWTLRREQEKG